MRRVWMGQLVLLAALGLLTGTARFARAADLPYAGAWKITVLLRNVTEVSFWLVRIDKTGKKAIPPQYHANWPEGLDAHFKDGKWGYVNETGKMIIAPLYAAAHKFSEGLAAVKNGDKWGYIDNTGKMVIPPQYLMADNFSEGLAAVESDDK